MAKNFQQALFGLLIGCFGASQYAPAANVAIIDSGISNVGRIPLYRDFLGEWDYAGHDWNPNDVVGHGTKVALSFLDYALGIPEGSPRITALKIGDTPSETAVYWAINDAGGYLINNLRKGLGGPSRLIGSYEIDVVNMSFGLGFSTLTHAALNNLYFNSDALMVMAAGNEGWSYPWSDPGYLAHYYGTRAIVVGAATPSGSIHGYSNRAGYTNKRNYIVAHAEASGPWAGTSFAAPRVAGTASALKDRWPHLSGAQLGSIILSTATDLGARGPDSIYGMGMLNYVAAFSPARGRWFSLDQNRYPVESSDLRISSAFAQVANQNPLISFFDGYDRDFKLRLKPHRHSVADLLREELRWQGLGQPQEELANLKMGDWTLTSTYGFDDRASADDISIQLSFDNTRTTLGMGFGFGGDWFYRPVGLPSVSSDRATTGVSPVLQLADGGMHFTGGIRAGQSILISSGYATNTNLFEEFEDMSGRDATSDAEAMLLSMTAHSEDRGLIGNITLSRIQEENGVLGSRFSGAFSQGTEEVGTVAMILGGDVALGESITFSGSYTLASTEIANDGPSMLAFSDSVASDAAALGLTAHGLFAKDDKMLLAVSRPLGVTRGSGRLAFDESLDHSGNMRTVKSDFTLVPAAREVDVQLGYQYLFREDSSLEAMFFHAQNFDHVQGVGRSGLMLRYQQSL